MRAARSREDFFVSPANALVLATLDAPEGWPQGRLILTGPEGAGKSHLAAIWAEDHDAAIVPAHALTVAIAPELAARGAVVIEDAEAIAGARAREEALFHLHNLLQAEGGLLLITAARAPRDWGLGLADLQSRMDACACVRLSPPDDALLTAVLVKLFADRQLVVAPALIDWLVTHMDRSLATARRLVDALDARALTEKRAITRPLAAQVLDSLAQGDQTGVTRP